MPTIEVVVPTTLKEFYNGCVKTINYERQMVALDGKSLIKQTCNKQIVIKPGMDPNCNFTFHGEGHQQPGRPSSNLFVNFVAVPHHPSTPEYHITSRYSRFKKDLFYKKQISLQDAINCRPVKIPLLDGRQILLSND
jgi:DnaJ-class molecular chaperone